MKHLAYLFLITALFSAGNTTYAQISEDTNPVEISVDLSPENPGPNQQVSATVSSYGTNLNAATISWRVNGQTKQSGVGKTQFTFTTGDMGTVTKIDIISKLQEGITVQNSLTVTPSSVDLIWQSESFTPPFYKGKAMYSHENRITFIAVPHIVINGREVDRKNLIYLWKENDRVVETASGYGKNTYSTIGSLISRPLKIEVQVSSPLSNSTAYGQTYIAPQDSSVVLYKIDPLYGIQLEKAINERVGLSEPEISVIGVPYFFGTLIPEAQGISYKWSINGVSAANDYSSRIQVFRRKEGVTGESLISLSVENSKKILQVAKDDFTLFFNENVANQSSF